MTHKVKVLDEEADGGGSHHLLFARQTLDEEEGRSQDGDNLRRLVRNGAILPNTHFKVVKIDLRRTCLKSLTSFRNLPIFISNLPENPPTLSGVGSS